MPPWAPSPRRRAFPARPRPRRSGWRSGRATPGAASLFAQSFRAAVLAGAPAAAADALRGQARIRLQQRRNAEAEELADLSREIAERHGEMRAVARATNVLALIRVACKDLDGARE